MVKFEVQIKKTRRADHANSVDFPKDKDAFVLVFNDNWNDYNWYTAFALWHFPDGKKQFMGELKILNKSNAVTYNLIKEGFESLDDDFCSIGQSLSYYRNLKQFLSQEECNKVLSQLRDCAFDKRIFEEFKSHEMMKSSLMRESYAIRAFSEAPLILSGLNPEEAYSFKYKWTAPYDRSLSMDWNVHFDYEPYYFKRCVGIIGENGVGKTRMLSSFVSDFFDPTSDAFDHNPIFSGIIVINSTKHDRYPSENDIYEFIKSDRIGSHLTYRQLSLDSFENVDDIVNAMMSLKDKPTLHNISILEWYRRSITRCISMTLGDLFDTEIKEKETTTWDGEKKIEKNSTLILKSQEWIKDRIRILSSGEIYSLALITFLYANIHMSSLVILDEPETHLHPSVLVNMMNCLYEVTERYDSYAIIATHSPLIIREILKQNVYRLKRVDGEIPSIHRVAFDTFGEDIASLYWNIFDYDEKNSLFTKVVREMASLKKQKTTEDIIKIISDSGTVNLNARMRITQILNEMQDA